MVVGAHKYCLAKPMRDRGSGTNTENAVSAAEETMSLLLISDRADKAAMLTRIMEEHGLFSTIHTIGPKRNAVAHARRSGRYQRTTPYDFILFDFSEPDEQCLSIVSDVAFGPNRARSPLILLTTPSSECLLESDKLNCGDSSMFAPMSLGCFINKMRQHSRSRFLRALSVMSDLGPVLVRVPGFFMRPADDISVQQVA